MFDEPVAEPLMQEQHQHQSHHTSNCHQLMNGLLLTPLSPDLGIGSEQSFFSGMTRNDSRTTYLHPPLHLPAQDHAQTDRVEGSVSTNTSSDSNRCNNSSLEAVLATLNVPIPTESEKREDRQIRQSIYAEWGYKKCRSECARRKLKGLSKGRKRDFQLALIDSDRARDMARPPSSSNQKCFVAKSNLSSKPFVTESSKAKTVQGTATAVATNRAELKAVGSFQQQNKRFRGEAELSPTRREQMVSLRELLALDAELMKNLENIHEKISIVCKQIEEINNGQVSANAEEVASLKDMLRCLRMQQTQHIEKYSTLTSIKHV